MLEKTVKKEQKKEMEQTENKLRIHFFNTNVLDNRFTHSEGLKMALRGCFKNILEVNYN